MPLLTTALNSIGLLLLGHAVYSAHEHTALTTSLPLTQSTASTSYPTDSTSPAPTTTTSIPLDITLELILSLTLLTLGIILSQPTLKPIAWSSWAGEIQRRGPGARTKGELKRERENPWRIVEERGGFWDVRTKREEFAAWVREGSKGEITQ